MERLEYVNDELRKIREVELADRFECECYERLAMIKARYADIWKVAALLNKCFSWSILAITSEIFLELTINSYLLYLSLDSGNLSVAGLSVYCLGMVPTVLTFMMACRGADRCTEMVSFGDF